MKPTLLLAGIVAFCPILGSVARGQSPFAEILNRGIESHKNAGWVEEVSYILYVLDEDAEAPEWAEYDRYSTKGQAIAAASIAHRSGLHAEIKEEKKRVAAPKSYVLWVRDPDYRQTSWKEAGRFASKGEAIAAERQAQQSGLETSVSESRGGWTTLPPIRTPEKSIRATLYQVVVAPPRFIYGGVGSFTEPSDPWQVVYETYDAGKADDYAIRLRSKNVGTVRVASKEVRVEESDPNGPDRQSGARYEPVPDGHQSDRRRACQTETQAP